MAKIDNHGIDKYYPAGVRSRKEHSEYIMNKIDIELREKNPRQPGPREIIINAYKEHGEKGALLALRLLNKRVKAKAYSWEDAKSWIAEYEKANSGGEICD